MTIQEYIKNINQRYKLGNATEHTFRGDLQQIIESLAPTIRATNEPKRQSCGAPDYILTKKDIPVGFIETKNIGDKDLEGETKTGNKEQFDRYKASLGNLIFTDYLRFYLYHDGQFITKVDIGELTDKGIRALPENFAQFENLIKDFCTHIGQTITSPKKLAEMMAGKARLLSEIIEKALTSDVNTQEDSTLKDQMNAFKQILIHDITPKGFADVYAQTIAYGMFAARLHDTSLDNFNRQQAAELIPKSNPFLRKLFGYISGPDIDDRIKWIVDSLADIFLACNVEKILKNYNKATKTEDPIIHFYETFLSEYDPKLRKARGVWYTPQPVVNFIVRAVDDILETEFDLSQGLADTSKLQITNSKLGIDREVHKVQILDPATGTGTFLAEVVKHIHKKFAGLQGIWSSYVEDHLLTRLNGFELLMASYAMAHLKLDLLLNETGYKPTSNQRFRIYLTNSLEEHHPDYGTLFANWLSAEANEANHIKRDTPVMVVMGNPPYSVSSSNKSEWIEKLTADYKKDLKEQNIQPLSDDYIKFIRFGQHFIDKNGSGVLAYISNNSFIDGIIHRQMRKHLLESFDKIYILNLHGNAKKKEISPDGLPDQNVFDIMQGVSINIFVKTANNKSNQTGQVFYYDLFGKRETKNEFLNNNTLKSIVWNKLKPKSPYYFFVNKDFKGSKQYENGFKIDELFNVSSAGIKTHRDDFVIDFDKTKLSSKINTFFDSNITDNDIKTQFDLKDNRDWNLSSARKSSNFNEEKIQIISYRPFDNRNIYYDAAVIDFPKHNVMQHLLSDNLALLCPRQAITALFGFFISKGLTDINYTGVAGQYGAGLIFHLYLYPEKKKKHDIFSGKANAKIKLQIKLEQAEANFKQVSKFFHTTVEPFFVQIEKPEDTNINLFEEHKSLYEEAETAVEQLKNQIKDIDNSSDKTVEIDTGQPLRKPNLNTEIVKQIARKLGLEFVLEKVNNKNYLAPIDILDYIYAVLHSPKYRIKYKEFLKIDFPRVPYPNDHNTFWQLVKLGAEIRQIHLMESLKVENHITQYPVAGDNVITRKLSKTSIGFELTEKEKSLGKVWINDKQYFDNVPETAWNFYVGGYQPAQKWLKDRKNRKLKFDDILHYHKIILALSETDRLMKAIDKQL